MAKLRNLAVDATLTLPGIPAKRGRPCSGKAMTAAERQRKYRKTHKAVNAGEKITATITRFAKEFDLSEDQITRELLRFALCNRNWSQTGFNVMRNGKEFIERGQA